MTDSEPVSVMDNSGRDNSSGRKAGRSNSIRKDTRNGNNGRNM